MRCLHVHAGLLPVIVLVAVLGAPDDLRPKVSLILPFFLERPICKSMSSAFLSDASFLGDAVLERVASSTVLLLLFVELRGHGDHLSVTILSFAPIAA